MRINWTHQPRARRQHGAISPYCTERGSGTGCAQMLAGMIDYLLKVTQTARYSCVLIVTERWGPAAGELLVTGLDFKTSLLSLLQWGAPSLGPNVGH